MASAKTGVVDVQQVKARVLRIQNQNGTFPAIHAVPVVSNTTGQIGFSRMTVDPSGNGIIPGNLLVRGGLKVDLSANVVGALTAASVTTPRLFVTPGTTAVAGSVLAANTRNQYLPTRNLNVSSVKTTSVVTQTITTTFINGETLPRFDPVKFVEIDPATVSVQDLAANYNSLLELLASRNAFVTLVDISFANVVFQTTAKIEFNTYPTVGGAPTTIEYQIPNSTIKINTLINELNALFVANSMPMGFTISSTSTTNVVTLRIETGTTFYYEDITAYGTADLFMNHLGLNALVANYPYAPSTYTGAITGVAVTNGRGSEEAVPSAPAAPTVVTAANSQITIRFTAGAPPVQTIGIYVNGVSRAIVPNTTSYTVTGLNRGTTYSIQISYLSDYDQGPLSPALSATTTNSIDNVYDIYYDANTARYNPTNYIPKDTPALVANTSPAIWSGALASLTLVSQIDHIEFSCYSGISTGGPNSPYYGIDCNTQFVFCRDTDPNNYAVSQVIFNAGASRFVPKESTDAGAVGCTDRTIARVGNEVFFQNMFGGGTNTIDRSHGIQFNWICHWNGTFINNCKMSEFKIYWFN